MKINPISMPKAMPNNNKKLNNPSFGFRPTLENEIEVYPNSRKEFVQTVYNAISKYPPKLKEIIQNHNYTITVTPSLNTTLLMRGIASPTTMLYEEKYPKCSMYTELEAKNNTKNIIIADKRPYSDNYAENIVNFALSTALTESLNLHKQLEIMETMHRDIVRFNLSGKLDKLNKNEARLLATELLDNNGKIKELEIIPDLIAWNLGGGKYGSGLYNVHDQFFTRNMFPETNYYLEGLLYKIKNK